MEKTNKRRLGGLFVFIILGIIYELIYYAKEDVWNRDHIIISTIMAIVYLLGFLIRKNNS